MSYIKGWNYALDKAITIVRENLGIDNTTNKVIHLLNNEKVLFNETE